MKKVANGQEPKMEPTDKDMAVFLGNASALKERRVFRDDLE